MPNYLAKTSLEAGGFGDIRSAISAPLQPSLAAMKTPPQVGWNQPKDAAKHLLNSLDVWLNFGTTAEAAGMDYSPMKYITHRQGSDPLRGYMSSQTCATLQIRQCCFRPIASPKCLARDVGTYDARHNAREAAGYSTPSSGPQLTFRSARQELKREREEQTETAIREFKMQRYTAAQDRLCEDNKTGRVRRNPPVRRDEVSKNAHPAPTVRDRRLQKRQAPRSDAREEHPLHVKPRIRMHKGAVPVQKPSRPVIADRGGCPQDAIGEKQRVEGRRGGPIRDKQGSPRSGERSVLPVSGMRLPSSERVRGSRTREARPRHDGMGAWHESAGRVDGRTFRLR